MKRSRAVHLTLLSSVAATLIACRERPGRYCVDQNTAVVSEFNCASAPVSSSGGYRGGYHWHYGGARGSVPIGTRLSGGSSSAPAGGFSSPASGTVRGGIGGAGEAASGHGGGEGGAGE